LKTLRLIAAGCRFGELLSRADGGCAAAYLAASTRFSPTIAGKAPVGNGSAFWTSGGSGARAVLGAVGLATHQRRIFFAEARQADGVLYKSGQSQDDADSVWRYSGHFDPRRRTEPACGAAAARARCDLIAAGFQRDVLVGMANAGNFRFLSASSKVTR
jgi:hypothetical protein